MYVLKKSLRRHRTPIAVTVGFVVVAAVALNVGSRTSTPATPAFAPVGRITSLAVLPFENLSADPEQEYFSDGMTEEMIAKLGRMQPETLRVIARTSAMRYKNTNKPLAQLARELGVQYSLEGSVRRANDRVRLTTARSRVS